MHGLEARASRSHAQVLETGALPAQASRLALRGSRAHAEPIHSGVNLSRALTLDPLSSILTVWPQATATIRCGQRARIRATRSWSSCVNTRMTPHALSTFG